MEIIIIVLLILVGTEGLVTFLAKHPGSGRLMVGGCGLFLTVFMTVTGITMWAEPKLRDGFTLLFFPWAGFGVWLMVKAAKER